MKNIFLTTALIFLSITEAQSYNMDMMEDIFNFDFERLRNIKVESASKFSQSLPNTPTNIVIITKDDIKKRGYRFLLDVFNDLPSFNVLYFANGGLYSAVGMRGIMAQNYFKILKDGVPISIAQNGLVSVGVNYPLVGIERIEILYGGASVIYGADAVTGVINLITDREIENSSTISVGLGGYLYGDIHHSIKLNDMLFTISAHWHRDEDYNFDKLYSSDYPKTPIMLGDKIIQSGEDRNFDYKPVHTKSVSFLLSSQNWDFGGFYSTTEDSTYISLIRDETKKELAEWNSNMAIEMRGVYFKYRNNFSNALSLISTISYNALELLPTSYYINKYSDYHQAYKYFITEKTSLEEFFQLNLQNHSISFGVDGIYFYSMPKSFDLEYPFFNKNAYYPNSDIPVNYYEETWTDFAIFAQDQIKIGDSFQLSLAGRYNSNEDYDNSFTPRFALIYHQSESITHKLIHSHSFLAPSMNEEYQHYGYIFQENDGTRDWDNNRYQINYARVPNPDLQPEKSKSFEYNYLQWIGSRSFLSISLFKIHITNLIETRKLTNLTDILPDTTFLRAKQTYNNSEFDVYGGDLSLSIKYRAGYFDLDSWFNYSYATGEGEEINELPYAKTHTINLGTAILYRNFTLTPSMKIVRGVNSGYVDKSGKLAKGDGYTLVDLYGQYEIDEDWIFSFNINNLFDKRYYDVRMSTSSTFQTPQRGRNLILSLKAKF